MILNHYKVTKTSRIKPSTRAHESTKETRISNKQGTKTKGMETRSKPRGHKEERASFPDRSTYRVSRIHGSNPREGRWSRETGRERWRQAQGGRPFCSGQAQGERGEGEGYLRCPRWGPKYPRLKLDTKTPVGAKPKICTQSHPMAEFLSLTRSLLRDASMSMKIRFAVLGGP